MTVSGKAPFLQAIGMIQVKLPRQIGRWAVLLSCRQIGYGCWEEARRWKVGENSERLLVYVFVTMVLFGLGESARLSCDEGISRSWELQFQAVGRRL